MFSARSKGAGIPALALTATLCAGCASLLGIDENYTLDPGQGGETGGAGTKKPGGPDASSATGGTAGGGTPASGGAETGGAGGAASNGGLPGTGGLPGPSDDCPASCQTGEKCCGGFCVTLSPLWGCSPDRCGSCPLPDHATGICDGQSCSFKCLPTYQTAGDVCVPSGTGGAGGKHDSGVPTPPQCNPATCTGCAPPINSPCCQRDNTCGCAFPGAPCFPNP
jgi:hypothetical protein